MFTLMFLAILLMMVVMNLLQARPRQEDQKGGKGMKRIFSALFALALLLTLLPAPASAAETVTINVYNWGQYIDDGTDDTLDVIAAFEEAYPNIKVNYMTFDSNESMYAKLEAGGTSFDVIVPSDYMVEKMIADDMLEPLDFENIPNFDAYLDESFPQSALRPHERLFRALYLGLRRHHL